MERHTQRTRARLFKQKGGKSLFAFLLQLEKKASFEICLLRNAGESVRAAKDCFLLRDGSFPAKPCSAEGPAPQLEEAKLLSVPIEFTPFLLLILWSVYFTGTGGLPECELETNVFLGGVSSFVFSSLLLPAGMGWDARPRLAQLLLLSCIFIFVFELKINMFLETHPISVQCRVKPLFRMSLSM